MQRGSRCGLLLVAASMGCGRVASEAPAERARAAFELREGERLFAAYCAACHGESGRGDGAYLSTGAPATPPDFTAVAVRGRLRRGILVERLRSLEALGETHCPPWGSTFSPEEIEALGRFVETLSGAGNHADARSTLVPSVSRQDIEREER